MLLESRADGDGCGRGSKSGTLEKRGDAKTNPAEESPGQTRRRRARQEDREFVAEGEGERGESRGKGVVVMVEKVVDNGVDERPREKDSTRGGSQTRAHALERRGPLSATHPLPLHRHAYIQPICHTKCPSASASCAPAPGPEPAAAMCNWIRLCGVPLARPWERIPGELLAAAAQHASLWPASDHSQ
jgi:hypothetical protein